MLNTDIIQLKTPILAENRPPTQTEMKKFAARFDKVQWAKLCESRDFLSFFAENLKKAEEIVNQILRVKT